MKVVGPIVKYTGDKKKKRVPRRWLQERGIRVQGEAKKRELGPQCWK